jgi:hypothetical protein
MQRRQIECRYLQGTFDQAYRATLQVLQDYGYIIKNTDYDAGVIHAETGIDRNWRGVMTNFEITATVEQFGENRVRQRLTIVKRTKHDEGEEKDTERISDPQLFQSMYNAIQQEMFVRRNLSP